MEFKSAFYNFNYRQVFAVILSVINLAWSFIAFLIIYEYVEIFATNSVYRLEFYNQGLDAMLIIFGLIVFFYSLVSIFKYFSHKKINLWHTIMWCLGLCLYLFLPMLLSFLV